jgi:hypothetical protein
MCKKNMEAAGMNALDLLEDMSRDTLIDIIHALGRNWVTVDGLWFQIVEREFGPETAVRFDKEMWGRQSLAEARRIKKALNITGKGPLAVAKANLFLTSYFNDRFNFEIKEVSSDRVIQTCFHCANQEARIKQGQEPFACKEVGLTERTNFAQVIDPEVNVKCLACPPDPHPEAFWCQWEFYRQV